MRRLPVSRYREYLDASLSLIPVDTRPAGAHNRVPYRSQRLLAYQPPVVRATAAACDAMTRPLPTKAARLGAEPLQPRPYPSHGAEEA